MSKARALVMIVVSGGMIATGALTWAQDDERQTCVEACKQVEDQCIDRCDQRDNPIECEERCQEAAEDCIYNCR